MTISDISILGKKILLGLIVTLVPFALIFGSLWLTPKLFKDLHKVNASSSFKPFKPAKHGNGN